MPKKLTQEEFINKCIEIHGDKYDYSDTIYINANTKATFICKKHGKFEQRAYWHLITGGCVKCVQDKMCSNTDEFINKSIIIHGDKYDYSKVEYIGCQKKVSIICEEHGEFKQTPNNHLNEQGCYKCKNNNQKYNLSHFLEKSIQMHGNKYDYSKSEYISIRTDIIITCKKHGDFLQKPNRHIEGQGCMKCRANNDTLTTDEFIKKATLIHGDKYNYSKTNYKYTRKKVIITCEKHGDFEQTAHDHVRGSGCKKCSYKFGIMENKWLDEFNIKDEFRQYKIDKYRVDGYDPNTNTIYEFNGDFWHGNPNRFDSNELNRVSKLTFGELYQKTLDKENKLKELGYNVISIWETDFLNEQVLS